MGEKNEMEMDFEEELRHQEERHTAAMQELEQTYTQKIMQDTVIGQMSAEAEEQERVLEETRRMIEEDCDLEIEQVRKMYEGRLQVEKDNLLRLKGDNGLIKKKNALLQKKWDDQDSILKAEQEKNTD